MDEFRRCYSPIDISITSHSGAVRAMTKVIGHPVVLLPNAGKPAAFIFAEEAQTQSMSRDSSDRS